MRMHLLGLALALAACGGDDTDEPTPPDPAEPVRFSIDVPAQLDVGDLLPVAWTVEHAPAGASVEIQLREPGGPITATLAGYLDTGSAPATGPRWWVDPDGVAAADAIALVDPAASGDLDVTLPTTLEGDWAVRAFLLAADGTPIAMSTSTVWIAAGPRVRLDLSRTWAEPDDVVHAAIDLRGAEAEQLRLSAWLTVPDGTVYSIPQLDTEYWPIGEGDLVSDRTELFRDRIGRYGEGEYVLAVTLETLDGVRRGGAGAVIQVCSQAGTIAGTIGEGAGRVLLLDRVDGDTFETEVDADGAFSAEVTAGDYLLLAHGDGWVAADRAEVGCGGVTTLAPTASSSVAKPTGPASFTGPVRAPKIVFELSLDLPALQEAADACFVALQAVIVNEAVSLGGGPVIAWTEDEQAAAMSRELADQRTNAWESRGGIDAALGDYRFLLRVISETGEELILDVQVYDAQSGNLIAQVSDTISASMGIDVDAMKAVVEELGRDLLSKEHIVAKMRAALRLPENPVVALTLDRLEARPGDTVTATLKLSEAQPAGPVPDRQVDFVVRVAGTTTVIQSSLRTTDALGNATETFVVPETPERYYEVVGTVTENSAAVASKAFQTRQPGYTGRITAAKGVLQTSERIELPYSTAGLGRVVLFSGVNGLPDATSGFADPSGHGIIGFVAGAVRGPATLLATFYFVPPLLTSSSSPVGVEFVEFLTPVRFFVESPINFTAFADPTNTIVNDAYVAIRGTVTRDGVPLPDLAISFARAGGGEIASGVKTDVDGAYSVLFRAPSTGSGSTTMTASVVVDSAIVRRIVQVNYGPVCASCPVAIAPYSAPDQMFPMDRGGSQLFSANQPVTWSVMGDGSITAQGMFAAGETGGTVLIRATSTTDSSNFAIARVVVECTFAEMDGIFAGTMSTVTTALAPYNCSTNAGARIQSLGGLQVDASVYIVCGASQYVIWGDFPNAQLESCTVGSNPIGVCPQFGLIGPDPDEPGMSHRRVIASTSMDVSGTCTTQFDGIGAVSE